MENEYVSFGCVGVRAPIGAWMEGNDLVWPGEASSIQLPEETTGSEIIGSPSRESVDGKRCFSDLSPCESVPYDGEAISVESHPWTQSTSFCGFGINSQCTCVHALGEEQRYPTGDWASIHIWGTSRIRDFWSSEYSFLLVNLRQLDSHKKFKRSWECLDIHKDILSDIHWQGEDPLKKNSKMLGRVRNAQVKHLPIYMRPWVSSSLLPIIKPAAESQKRILSRNSIHNFHPGNLGHLPSLRIVILIREQAKTTSNFKMKGKLAIKAQTYNQDGFDSSVCVCNRLLKTLWEGLKIPKVASEPQWSVLSDAGPSDNRRNLTLYHKAILTTTSQFVLFFRAGANPL